MTTLHLVRTSSFADDNFQNALTAASAEDGLVLLDDGCYALHAKELIANLVQKDLALFIVASHLKARGIESPLAARLIAMTELVDLTFSYQRVITWQ